LEKEQNEDASETIISKKKMACRLLCPPPLLGDASTNSTAVVSVQSHVSSENGQGGAMSQQ